MGLRVAGLRGLVLGAVWLLAANAVAIRAQPVDTSTWFSVTETRVLMGSEFRITSWAEDTVAATQAIGAAFDRMADIERSLSDYDPASEVSRLSASGAWATMSGDLDTMVSRSRVWLDQTGVFDVTLGSLTRLWRRAMRRQVPPDGDAIRSARGKTGWEQVEISGHKIRLKDGVRLDFGGIAKGFAADEAYEVLTRFGFPRSLVDAAGDLRIGQAPPGTDGWRIGVQSADGQLHELTLVDRGIATSGDHYRFLQTNGIRYSHILDPETGLGTTTQRLVTVIAACAEAADVWASALSIGTLEISSERARRSGVTSYLVENGQTHTWSSVPSDSTCGSATRP